jgi:hypothetical protein
LNILCEDEEAEGILLGIFDYLNPRLRTEPGDIKIGRNTGKDEFPTHLKALAKFDKTRDFIFILDGDAKDAGAKLKSIAENMGHYARILYLPKDTTPEVWAFEILEANYARYAKLLGVSEDFLRRKIIDANSIYSLATDTPSNIAKEKIYWMAQNIKRDTSEILRIIGQNEAQEKNVDIKELLNGLEEAINQWRLIKY